MSRKIMIIDDEAAILEALKIVLESRGYETCTVNRPEEYETCLVSFRPDIIFVDLSMPGMGGAMVVKGLKEHSGTKEIPVVVISAHTDTERRAQEAGADDYLEKPFRVSDFLQKVASLTDRSS